MHLGSQISAHRARRHYHHYHSRSSKFLDDNLEDKRHIEVPISCEQKCEAQFEADYQVCSLLKKQFHYLYSWLEVIYGLMYTLSSIYFLNSLCTFISFWNKKLRKMCEILYIACWEIERDLTYNLWALVLLSSVLHLRNKVHFLLQLQSSNWIFKKENRSKRLKTHSTNFLDYLVPKKLAKLHL